MKPACVPCQRFFRPHKTGVRFVEGMPRNNDASPGTTEPDAWQPYKYWTGDLWRCEGCGAEIIVGVGFEPIAEHYQQDFDAQLQRGGSLVQINDC